MNKDKRLTIILLSVPTLLLIPFLGMQFTSEIDWSPFDFAIMGTLLLSVGLIIELVLRRISGKEGRIAIIAILAIVFLLVWVELAVGIFGTPFAGS